ncbi:MAG: transporter substrate-binding domain-containing protein, partial [Boseongicola sp.]|nr:transporter substrate-binding domain-containing protein [Boseongicola sp.]
PTMAHAQDACATYRVQIGDSLADIAKRAYGFDNHARIWRENREEIGRNPNIIRVGSVLRLPCLDGAMPTEQANKPNANSDAVMVSFVTSNGYLPYTDESLAERGLMTNLVRTAMMRGAPDKPFDIVFVNDRAAHVESLLPRQAFDASFPWTRPGCETQGELTSMELYACQNFMYSQPFYEIVDGFFSRTGTGYENVIDFAAFEGATICRPEGYSTGHLEENGLMPPAIELVQPASTHECFEQLMTNSVDLVAMDTRAGERVMEDLNLTYQVTANPHLFSIQPMQVAFHKDNSVSAEVIEDLNRGLAQMLETGEWASIVSLGLRDNTKMELVN